VTLLDSLLDAIVRLDGEALVMHTGEKPYVVLSSVSISTFRGPLSWGQVELSSRPLTGDAVLSMLGQMLSPDQSQMLNDLGAIEHEIDAPGDSGERFTVTAARGGDDVWVEVRRRKKVAEVAAEPIAETPAEPLAAPEPEAPPQALEAPVTAAEPEEWVPVSDLEVQQQPDASAEAARALAERESLAAEAARALAEREALAAEAARALAAREAELAEAVQALAAKEQALTAKAVHALAAKEEALAAEAARALAAKEADLAADAARALAAKEEALAAEAALALAAKEQALTAEAAHALAAKEEALAAEAARALAAKEADLAADAARALGAKEEALAVEAGRALAAKERALAHEAARALAEKQEALAAEAAHALAAKEALLTAQAEAAIEARRAAIAEGTETSLAAKEASLAAEAARALAAKEAELAVEAARAIAAKEQALAAEAGRALAAKEEALAAVAARALAREEALAAETARVLAREEALTAEAAHALAAKEEALAAEAARALAAKEAELAVEAARAIAAKEQALAAEVGRALAAKEEALAAVAARVLAREEALAAETARVLAREEALAVEAARVLERERALATEAARALAAKASEDEAALAAEAEAAKGAEELSILSAQAEAELAAEARVAQTHEAESGHAAEVDAALAGAQVGLAADAEAALAAEVDALAAEPEAARVVAIAPSLEAFVTASLELPPPAQAGAEPHPDEVPVAVVRPIARPSLKLQPPQPPVPPSASSTEASLVELLRAAASHRASTVYALVDTRPMMRVDGQIALVGTQAAIAGGDVERFIYEFAPRDQVADAAPEWTCEVPGVGRVRCVTFRDQSGAGLIFHLPSPDISTADEIGLGREVQALCAESDGLIVVAGPRFSGKSTLLGAFVDLINRTRYDHIITIESQIRVLHEKRLSFISQREVRGDGEGIAAAARAALREGPDVLVIEDLRAPETLVAALDAARAGRLVFGTISAQTAPDAIERLIDAFPADRRSQIRAALAGALRAVVAQVLVRKKAGGRVAAREVLLSSPAVRKLLLDGATWQLPIAVESGRSLGMNTMVDSLGALVRDGVIEIAEACAAAPDRRALIAALARDGVDVSGVERRA
jgi:twitching motility protein PilT